MPSFFSDCVSVLLVSVCYFGAGIYYRIDFNTRRRFYTRRGDLDKPSKRGIEGRIKKR